MKTKLLFSFFFFLLLLEIGLRITGLYASYSERSIGYYQSYFGKKRSSWYFTWQPNLDFIYKQKEFSYRFQTNSLGIREKEMSKVKDSTEYRIIVLGDSFTEGDGVAYAYSYPRNLEKKLNESCSDGRVYAVYNAGVSGSDVLYFYTLLKDKLLDYHPDFVIVNINNSDINDFVFRGGTERFLADGTTENVKGPWYKSIFMFSHTFRMFIKIFNPDFDIDLMIDNKKLQDLKYKAKSDILIAINLLTDLCIQNNIKFTFILHPFAQELHSLKAEIQNLLLYVPEYVPIINTFKAMDIAFKEYDYNEVIWPINLHFNKKGYEIMANVIFEELLKSNSLIFENCEHEKNN